MPEFKCLLHKKMQTGETLSLRLGLEGMPGEDSVISWDDDWAAEYVQTVIIGRNEIQVRLRGFGDVEDYRKAGWK